MKLSRVLDVVIPDPEDVVVYDGTAEFAAEIVRLSFREKNKWFLSQGQNGQEISTLIRDKAFLEKVARREVVFGHGDVVRVRLHTISRRRGSEPIRSEYFIEEVLALTPAPEQLNLTSGERVAAESQS